jgi:branched-chain amino acid transport system permease protein
MWGVIVGGFAIAYLPERFRFLQDKRYLVFGIALVIMMIFRPQGLLPRRQRAAELTRAALLPDASDPLAEEAADATVAERRDDA